MVSKSCTDICCNDRNVTKDYDKMCCTSTSTSLFYLVYLIPILMFQVCFCCCFVLCCFCGKQLFNCGGKMLEKVRELLCSYDICCRQTTQHSQSRRIEPTRVMTSTQLANTTATENKRKLPFILNPHLLIPTNDRNYNYEVSEV